ncbi:hypothetical protein GLAREA_02524 [Glarea lozoyensis ATCC 20868]|uniref:Uncharacterized protein n=1 Tax=Glarea lozoyensis (strain ATCC 20868 / MF5171) TaxID=1116229 RepID=S3D3G3_GLAL2|nr:uncharacterized protein GLAREA_02524 [Glarea lozoyensis ATCC 20868]EPE26611.1 hypothetical protein GLAREA_02524 [Glarea lozoyensis ATCC 20868]
MNTTTTKYAGECAMSEMHSSEEQYGNKFRRGHDRENKREEAEDPKKKDQKSEEEHKGTEGRWNGPRVRTVYWLVKYCSLSCTVSTAVSMTIP